ncbi:MAG: hypothetical protein BWK76_25430 [Desulfobulbaceae bacterium A2]|nr:MAG: hypothetical protein BWK76_25430 [Desulfobulbaceae bacterium A2]
MLAAALDLGTNTFCLLVAEVVDGRLRELARRRVTVRLGEGLVSGARLQSLAIERGLCALEAFRPVLADWPGCCLRVFGTEALRRAVNRDSFLLPASHLLGRSVEVLAGTQEAAFSLRGALSCLEGVRPDAVWLADVGGGSSELALALAEDGNTGQHCSWSYSLPLGAVGLSEGCPEEEAMNHHIHQQLVLALAAAPPTPPAATLLATGGSASAMACLHLGLKQYERERVQGLCLTVTDLAAMEQRLGQLSPAKRNKIPCLGDRRGEILPAGIRIFHSLLNVLGIPALTICESGFLEGALFAAAESEGQALISAKSC